MVVPALDLLEKYATKFREMIGWKVRSGQASVKQLLKLSKVDDWEFLIAARCPRFAPYCWKRHAMRCER
jgi:hypothetical protein